MNEEMIKLAYYLIDNDIQVVALAPGLKYPTYPNWQNIHLTKDEICRAISQGWGIGIKPNDDFVVVDLDSDHGEYDGVSNFNNNFGDQHTLLAMKDESNNQHLFFKNTYNLKVRLTGNASILDGVDIFTRDNEIRSLPAYEFLNLDYNRPFIEQLSESPRQFELLKFYESKPETYKPHGKHNIDNYLKKVDPFSTGSRSESYRRLIYTMVVKNGMAYDDVKQAVDEWDAKTIDFQSEEPDQYEHATREPKGRN